MCGASGIFFPCIYVCAWRECSACVGQKKELPCSWQASNPGPLNCWVISSPCSLISNFYFVPGVINLLLFLQLGNVLCAMTSLASSQPHCSFMYWRVGAAPTSFEWPVAQRLRVWVCFYVPGPHDLAGLSLFFVSSFSDPLNSSHHLSSPLTHTR